MAQTRIQLAPKAGFCIKTTTVISAVLPPDITQNPKKNSKLLEPAPAPRHIPPGRKVFVNIAWDANVPPPPEGSEEAVRRAMQGVDPTLKSSSTNGSGEGEDGEEWYVPVIVSPAREDTDKAGKASLVFDCVYNSSLRSRTLREPEFKVFLVELGLQRIEAQTGLSLSRTVGAPNIASKGPLAHSDVLIPTVLLHHGSSQASPDAKLTTSVADLGLTGVEKQGKARVPLIEEISPRPPTSQNTDRSSALPGPKGILKKSTSASEATPALLVSEEVDETAPLEWDWTTTMEKASAARTGLRITVRVPGATPSLIERSTLDIGPRTVSLCVPGRPPLDLDLALSDAEIVVRVGSSYTTAPAPALKGKDTGNAEQRQAAVDRALRLKRQHDFDVEGAEAEWRLGSAEVVLFL